MPIITVKVIKGVVLTSDEQKRELLEKMTDAFIGVVGDVARPYTYCIIEETPLFEWSIGGRPLPDLPFLYGPEYAEMHSKANAIMKAYIESQSAGDGAAGGNGSAADAEPLAGQTPDMGDEAAQAQWAGG
jgi:4-oxalocrotonate tautomerase